MRFVGPFVACLVASLAFACAQRRSAILEPIADSSVGTVHPSVVVRPSASRPASQPAVPTSVPTVAGPFERVGRVDGTLSPWDGLTPISADGRCFLTDVGGNVRVWSAISLRPLSDPLPLSPGSPYRLSQDGRTVLTASGGKVRLWDVATSKLRWSAKVTSKNAPKADVATADLSPDAQTVAAQVGLDHFQFVVWHVGEPQPRCWVKQELADSVEFDRSGQWIVTYAGVNGAFRVRSADTGQERCPLVREYVVHTAGPPHIATLDAGGRRLLLPTEHMGFEIVDATTGQPLLRTQATPPAWVHAARFCCGDSRVILATDPFDKAYRRLRVYDAATGKFEFEIPADLEYFDLDASGRWAICWSPPPNEQAAVFELWDVTARTKVQTFQVPAEATAYISPDGKTMLISLWRNPFVVHGPIYTEVWRRSR